MLTQAVRLGFCLYFPPSMSVSAGTACALSPSLHDYSMAPDLALATIASGVQDPSFGTLCPFHPPDTRCYTDPL